MRGLALLWIYGTSDLNLGVNDLALARTASKIRYGHILGVWAC